MFTVESVNSFFDEFLEGLINSMNSWEGFDEFIEPVKKFRNYYAKKVGEIHSPGTHFGAINVLNHGDFHPKNVLYKMKSDGAGVEDFMMVNIFMKIIVIFLESETIF